MRLFFCFEAGVPCFSAMPEHPIYHTHTQRLTCLRKGAQARQNHRGNEPCLPTQTLHELTTSQSIKQKGTTKHNEAHYLFSKQLNAHYKTTINHGRDDVASTPVTDEKATTTGRAETLEQNGKVKTNTNTYRLQNSDSTRANTVKTKIVTREPQTILNNCLLYTSDAADE